jgi:membrane protease YdiL (CAAX protease family)
VEPGAPIGEPPIGAPARIPPIERAAAAFEVILCSGFPTQLVVIVFLAGLGMRPRLENGGFNPPFVFALTLLDTALLVALVVLFFRAHRESFAEQLFAARPSLREALYGIVLIPTSFFIVIAVLLAVQAAAPWLRNVPHNPLADLAKTRAEAIVFAFVVMVAGGVREEIQRGFVLRRFEQYLGGGVTGLLVFSSVFGLGHLDQGHDVALATAILGAFWGAVFLRRRSIAGPMVGHAGFNLLQVVKFLTWGG